MRITDAKYLKDYELEVTFFDGQKKRVDLKNFILSSVNPDVVPYQDLSRFKKVKVTYGSLNWGNHQIDISGESLYNWKD